MYVNTRVDEYKPYRSMINGRFIYVCQYEGMLNTTDRLIDILLQSVGQYNW